MCLERSKYEKQMTFRLKMKWSPFCDRAPEDAGLKPEKRSLGKVTIRPYPRQKQRQARPSKPPRSAPQAPKEAARAPPDRPAREAPGPSRPPGAMAPPNTTQYLMDGVYEDMKTSAPLPAEGPGAPFDSCSERCLYFQQKDFEALSSADQQ